MNKVVHDTLNRIRLDRVDRARAFGKLYSRLFDDIDAELLDNKRLTNESLCGKLLSNNQYQRKDGGKGSGPPLNNENAKGPHKKTGSKSTKKTLSRQDCGRISHEISSHPNVYGDIKDRTIKISMTKDIFIVEFDSVGNWRVLSKIKNSERYNIHKKRSK